MKYSKWFVWLALAACLSLPGARTLSAQPYYGREARVERIRADIARDEARRNEAIRCGRYREADRISRDIARDREALRYELRGWR